MKLENLIINKTYLPRLKTDTLFELPMGSFDYSGVYDSAVRFVMEHQSKNTTLWKTFVDEFKNPVDAADGGWRGEFWGKMMRGAAWVYKYTKNEELYAILEESVRDLLSAEDSDGRFSTYVKEKEFSK